ncbi:gliding motility-associated C-terminal domain-containing protein [Chitinophaga sedimenti]|uniref:DUF7507 domain-containing protein n=1 Tax=Chitinophaga sedimenti TaxID=2033606 RepID=UPI0020038940|nr:gliding motility-associated C-terminal domain-containing protein [Chitinophaga sedimenti]MCK7555990.1 gliding motility-associated C-terminal domain-containing protein [Chitinophaga sedimenti]
MVTNSGNVTLSNVVLADPVIGLNKTLSGNIAPGASVTDIYDYTITQADRDKGMVTNSANVSAAAPAGATVTDVSGTAADNDEPTVTVITSTAAVAMVKTGVFSGNTITYTFTITNTGNVTLSQLTYSDAKLGITDKALEVTGGLAPGATATATEIYTVTADDRTLGSVTNTATVNAQNPNGGGVSDVSGSSNDNDDATVTQVPNAPVAVNDAVTTNANNPVTINVLLNDDPISSTFDLQSVQVVTQPQHGTVILNQDGTITYTPAVGYVGADSLTYRVKDAFGFYTNEAKVNIAVTFTGIKAPTVFTPNGDGRNDRFVIAGLNQYVENELIIVNRWGNEVYRQRNYQQNWEALKLHEGTYYYLLRVKKAAIASGKLSKDT